MTSAKKSSALAVIMAVGALAVSAQSAAAYVVCNSNGECWHTERHYRAPTPLQWHRDDYYFHRTWDHDHWRDSHAGRGYYRNGVWITF
ncbi:MAG TPA: hypothetical protein VG960_12835 [Caulobacteraceae bacterium]|nr:hypothetical protein [Caulobacteraceae bacterium]